MENIEAIKKIFNGHSKRIVITMHQLPDADAMGSSLGLATFLKKKNHQVNVISPTEYPDLLAWMPGIDEVLIWQKHHKKSIQHLKAADIICCLDFSVMHRIHKMAEIVKNASARIIVIDHHLDPENFSDLAFWNPKASSTAELIYTLIEKLEEKTLLDKNIAACLYTGIMTDTGSFKYPNTTAYTHRVVASLIDIGINAAEINRLIYDNNSLDRLQFMSFVIMHRLVVLEACKTAYFAISAADLKKFDLKTGDTEGIVNYALSLKNIVLAALIMEKEDRIKISFRSIGEFPVHTLAKAHFGGGGHKNAAGGNSDLTFEATVKKFEYLVKQN